MTIKDVLFDHLELEEVISNETTMLLDNEYDPKIVAVMNTWITSILYVKTTS